MPGKNNAVDELCAMKARCVGENQLEDPSPEAKSKAVNRLFAPIYWRILAALLALFCGTFLVLSYIEITRIKQRATELKMLEDRLMGGEQRLIVISAEIGKMNAQRGSLQGEILKLETNAAGNAESSAESRLLKKTLPPLKEEYTQLLSKVSGLHENKSSLEQSISGVQAKLAELNAAYSSQSESLQSLEKEVKEKRAALIDIEKSIAEKQAAITGASRSLIDYEGQLTSVKNDYEKHKKDAAELQAEKATVKKSIVEQETALVSLREAQVQAKGRLDGLSAEITRLTEQIASDRKQATDLEKRKRLLADEVAALQTDRLQLKGLSEKITSAKKELVAVEAQLDAKNAKIDELNQKALQEEGRIVDRQATIGGLEGKISELEAKQLDITKDISRMQGQQEILKQQKITGKTDQPG